MTHDKETLINILKLNASFLADAKKLDEVTCALDIVQSLAWQLEEILQQEKSAIPEPTEMTVKNNPDTLSDNKEKKSSYHVKPQILGNCSACGWPVYEGDEYEYTDNGFRHQSCKPDEKEKRL